MSSSESLTPSEKAKLTRLGRILIQWSSANGRDFPWRRPEATTYEQIVVEVMLQRTTATAVARFYDRFFQRFPDWGTLAEASVEELEEFLRPLGLWRRRAKSLLGISAYARDNRGHFPRSVEEHSDIPAVGQYVSNAIRLFQHGESAPLLDVNMARVIERYVRPRKLADIRHDPWLQEAAHWYSRGRESANKNWAILDFAAKVCKARAPACPDCPLRNSCTLWKSARLQRD